MAKRKQPKVARIPEPQKNPKIANPPPRIKGQVLAWRFNSVDRNGPFAWTNIPNGETFRETIEKLAGYETMREHELAPAGCHAIPLANLCSKARDRLVELELDDLDSMYSFRVTGKIRVFGVMRADYIRVLWYDPEHLVCPSVKRHT